VQYAVNVCAKDLDSGTKEKVFATHVTFVCLDDNGAKRAVAPATVREG
jgi:predicted dinucleotide-binding enzyme